MSVPSHIRTNLLEMGVVLAACTWHQTHTEAREPQHAEPVDEAERDRLAEQAADRLHQAVTALQAEYDRQDIERQAS